MQILQTSVDLVLLPVEYLPQTMDDLGVNLAEQTGMMKCMVNMLTPTIDML